MCVRARILLSYVDFSGCIVMVNGVQLKICHLMKVGTVHAFTIIDIIYFGVYIFTI